MRAEILGQERRRRWTDQQRLEIIGSVGVDGATLAEVARRHEITRQQIYTWRHDMKKRGFVLGAPGPVFLPVDMPAVRGAEVAYNASPSATSMIELRLTQGRTLRFDSEIEAITLTPAHSLRGGGVIGPGTGVRVYLACGVTDMRKGISGLAQLAQTTLRQKPTSGAVFACTTRSCSGDVFLGPLRQTEPHD